MDDAPHRQIPVDDRAALRFFAFWLANGTLIINYDDPVPDYEPLLEAPGPWLGTLIEGHLAGDHVEGPSIERWLYDHLRGRDVGPPPTLPAGAADWKHLIARFARELGWHRIPEGVDPDDVVGLLCEWGGSPLELVFATLGNVIALDEAGRVCNADAAFARGVDMLRSQFEMEPRPDPPFTEWETTLWT